jgi:hypothetical protein
MILDDRQLKTRDRRAEVMYSQSLKWNQSDRISQTFTGSKRLLTDSRQVLSMVRAVSKGDMSQLIGSAKYVYPTSGLSCRW